MELGSGKMICGAMKTFLTILVVAGVSFANAQDSLRLAMVPEANARKDTVSSSVKANGPISFNVSDEGRSNRSGSPSVLSAIREEINSLAVKLPDLSVSWLGFSGYVRNPLRYKLSPGSTYPHQIGFSKGDWTLSIDGIKTNTLEDLHIALQYPFGKSMTFLVRYNDMQYKVGIQSFGALPWE